MKNRLFTLILAGIVLLGISACGKKEPASSEFELSLDTVDECIESFAEYKGITVDVAREEISEEMLDYYTEYFFSIDAEEIEGWVADNGDTVVIDFVGTIDGVAFSGGTAEGQQLVLGSHSYISGFEDGLLGSKAGDVRTLDLMFPEEYPHNPDLAGQPCQFEVTVQKVIPGVSDAAVAALNSSLFSTAAEYRAFVQEAVNEYTASDYENNIVNAALNKIIGETQFKEIPSSILEKQKEYVNTQYSEIAGYYGVTVEYYLQVSGTTVESLAENFAKQQIAFYKIAKEEGIELTEEEINDEIEFQIQYYEYDSEEAYFAEHPKEELLDSILCQKVYKYLLEVTKVETSEE